MKIVFIGSVQFSEKILKHLILLKANIVGTVTLEKSPFNADHVDLTTLCKQKNIPVIYSTDINSEYETNWIKILSPDIIFCFGWSRLLKKRVLNLAPMGVLGYHPAELPKNRGRHPLIWALVLGLKKTASTFFFMDDGADTGDILSQCSIKIKEHDNAETLYIKMTKKSIDQITEFLPLLISGNYKKIKQDNNKSNAWRKRTKNDGIIDWRMSANSIQNLVRGLTKPYVGAHFNYNNVTIKVWEIKVVFVQEKNIEPGKVIFIDKEGIVVKTGEDAIKLIKTEPILDINKGMYL